MKEKSKLIIEFKHIMWTEKLWKKYIHNVKKIFSIQESDEVGTLCISNTTNKTKFEIQVIVSMILSDMIDKYMIFSKEIYGKYGNRIQLPINEHVEATTYLFYSTRLAILNANQDTSNAMLDSFLNIHLYYNILNENYVFFDEKINDFLLLQFKDYDDVNYEDGIINYIRKNLINKTYVNVHLDDFYISQKDFYNKKHYVHENLIWGYDDQLQIFMAYGVNIRQQMSNFMISYNEIVNAYEKGKLFYFCGAKYLERPEFHPILLLKPKKMQCFTFTEARMKQKVRQFLDPHAQELVEDDIHVYGREVYNYILDDLKRNIMWDFVDYRVFHLLYEHKKCLKRSMEWLIKHEKMSANGILIYNQMNCLIQDYNSIRLMYLNQIRKENKLYYGRKVVEDLDVRNDIAKQLEKAISSELSLLRTFAK